MFTGVELFPDADIVYGIHNAGVTFCSDSPPCNVINYYDPINDRLLEKLLLCSCIIKGSGNVFFQFTLFVLVQILNWYLIVVTKGYKIYFETNVLLFHNIFAFR